MRYFEDAIARLTGVSLTSFYHRLETAMRGEIYLGTNVS